MVRGWTHARLNDDGRHQHSSKEATETTEDKRKSPTCLHWKNNSVRSVSRLTLRSHERKAGKESGGDCVMRDLDRGRRAEPEKNMAWVTTLPRRRADRQEIRVTRTTAMGGTMSKYGSYVSTPRKRKCENLAVLGSTLGLEKSGISCSCPR